MREAYVSATAFRKYNTYKNFAGTLSDDLCVWLLGKSKSYFLDWTLKRMMNYTNLGNRTCPLEGEFYLKVDNISMDTFPISWIMPSSRYRIDLNFSETYGGQAYSTASIYGAVSDHRVEQY